ncbi:CTP synthetase [Alkalispirochaeta sphaeroplastigenens]|uniref:CTP synthase n=1 Tax=Alkalispirochaeta sphaeroplastigenens TaxID=1187066 RepID=A0A2S4JS02_9SPIO|nr:CTP synthase [Alkalispirochaeta sphaeroplastigenens]POR02272.1 CTP synthetase [Alkalispirochaeta sphaeroplastigenens]
MNKYIFVTGGVCSSLGKGVAAASLGSLLESRGLTIRMIKVDPYINVDAGTMSPYQHGEVYVTDDGAETDLDLGNYARFTKSTLSRANSITTGQIYQEVIQREREGRYLGRTVQVIPHITDRIKQRIRQVGDEAGVDLTIVEVGGTVGDIESFPFLEAVRQMMHELGKTNVLSVHLTLIPVVANGELKTKPTQHSVKELREIGIQPDILLCRAPLELPDDERRKIALFTNVEHDSVISACDVKRSLYEIPLMYHRQGLDRVCLERLGLEVPPEDLSEWEHVVSVVTGAERQVRIAVVGKYIELSDTYKSVDEAIIHGAVAQNLRVELVKVDSERLDRSPRGLEEAFAGVDGILVPGGFGGRGVEGMVAVARYARERKIPYFGICLGMQIMVIEYARSVLGYESADSTEFAPDCEHPVVSLLEEQVDVKNYGGTMRLGLSVSRLLPDTLIRSIYGRDVIHERHRHRYEVSNLYRQRLDEAGLVTGSVTEDFSLVESVEWRDHPWGLGVQFHPEFVSKPVEAHPLFRSFLGAAGAFQAQRPPGADRSAPPDQPEDSD